MQYSQSPQKDITAFPYFAYDAGWVGRKPLIAELTTKLHKPSRLLLLTGITGIGKTALAERLVETTQDFWTGWGRLNFDDEEKVFDFSSAAADLLIQWGEVVTPEDRKRGDYLLERLIDSLEKNSFILVIDSLENILQGDEEQGWSDFQDSWWLTFFQRFLSLHACHSRIILTSQDIPGQLQEKGSRYQTVWWSQPLDGLDKTEQMALFAKAGIAVHEPLTHSYIERIGAAYEGHPLALRVIAGEIGSIPFRGNVIAYWQKYGQEIEVVEQATKEATEKGMTASASDPFQLERYTRNLRRHVRARLKKTLERLKNEAYYAYIMLCEASVYRCAVQETFWLNHLTEDWECSQAQSLAAMDMLRDRFLVEDVVEHNRCLVRQHNLIRSVALEELQHWDDGLRT